MRVHAHTTEPAGWDEYVRRHPLGTACHLAAGVRLGHEVFGLRTWFIAAEVSGRIAGVLPVVEQSSLAFGRFLVSLPFFTYGGCLADDGSVATALIAEAGECARRRRAKHAELRHRVPVAGQELPERLDKVSLVLDLPASESELAQVLGSKLRSQIRRAEREHPEVVWGHKDLVGEFYTVFSASMRDLGTPVYPRRFFEAACDAFGPLLSILVLRVSGTVQAAAILLRHGDSIEVPWAAASDRAKRNAVNMRMYWELLCNSIRAGAATFDFGRSTVGSGTYRFKVQWGATPRQLHWHYLLPPGKAIPVLNHSNRKYALATAAWKRLPLWCANALGPLISRSLP